MNCYSQLHELVENADEKQRTVQNLINLRQQLNESIPAKDAEDHLLLATWNIRDFGKANPFGWGGRLCESWFYIAEMISRFDFVAVQEVSALKEWHNVMAILGDDWDFIATDATDTKLGGNGERMVFVFDTRKVHFQNIAGEIVLPSEYLISKTELEIRGDKIVAGNQFKRTPFMAAFKSHWLEFDICTVHLYYGDKTGDKLAHRIDEINTIAKYLSERADRALGEERALILLGDFNIVSPQHQTMQALLNNGFFVPQALQAKPTTDTAKHYDQIAFKTSPRVVRYMEEKAEKPAQRSAGAVPLFEQVFTNEQFTQYADIVKTSTSAGKKATTEEGLINAYKKWRTFQFSDHYPMWVRLQTNSSDEYLFHAANQAE